MGGVSTKEIRTRIRSMEATRQITKAMQMVAASKLRRAQEQALAARPYFKILYETVNRIAVTSRDLSSPYLRPTAEKKPLYLVVAGDRGLAGGYNGNVFKLVMSRIHQSEATVLPIGKKAAEYFHGQDILCVDICCAEAATLSLGDCFTVAKQVCRQYRDGNYDEVFVVYTDYVSALLQVPRCVQLLPLKQNDVATAVTVQGMLYEPDVETVFDAMIPEYVGGVLYGALCASRASEHAARRAAMDSATKNADEMIEDLRLRFNQARQAGITQEITEIIAGAKRS